MALTIKDGAGSTTSLKTTLTGSDHMPHHIVQAVSGTVTVTSSLASPVYVTGNISISQPVNVDLVLNDTITASVSNTVTVTASTSNPIAVRLQASALTLGSGLPITASSAYPVYVTGSVSSISTISGPVTASIVNSAADPVYLTGSIYVADTQNINGKLALLVKTTGSEINNVNISDINSGYTTGAGPSKTALLVSLTGNYGENTFRIQDIIPNNGNLPITGTIAIGNIPTINLGNVVTYYQSVPVVATQLTGNSVVQTGNREALLTSVTGTAFVSFGELTPAFTASMENPIAVKLPNQVFVSSSLFEVSKVSYSEGSALVVRVTASNNETYPVTLSGVSTSAFSEGQALVVRITSSNENNPVHITGNVSIVSTEAQPVITKTKSITNVQKQTYSATYGFSWTTDSGTFVVADADTNRKSLMIHNPSQYEVYVSVGSSSLNGFYIWDVAQPPDNFSFIIYPSGTYTADEYAAAAFHACYFVSQSYNYQKVCVTEIGY